MHVVSHTSCSEMNFTSCCLCLTLVVLGASFAVSQYEERYITVPVDHFSFFTERVFNLRYLINDTFTQGNSNTPILFYCGNEANVEFFANSTGFIWELAPKINALIVFAEHRYYGKSVPHPDASDNGQNKFGYLSMEQALADFADVLNSILNVESRPVIAIGGSYGGILAALFRIKYPHLVAGALASSAPLRQFSNMTACETYSQVISNVFRLADNEFCAMNIKKSWTTLKEIASAEGGVEFFNQVFGFCEPWTSPQQVDDLIYKLDSMYWHMAMTNYPYAADIYADLPANPVKKFCSSLRQDYSGRDLVKALRRALDVYVNSKGESKCFQFLTKTVMSDADRDAWRFQTCTELLTGMCDREHSMFPNGGATYTETLDSCKTTYGDRVKAGAERIKKHFGVDNLKHATNIIFSNGLLDPWSAASVLTAPNDQTLVINIPDGAHHIDLRHSNMLDPPSVRHARQLEHMYLMKWIREFRRRRHWFM